jgi:hypothetical protein
MIRTHCLKCHHPMKSHMDIVCSYVECGCTGTGDVHDLKCDPGPFEATRKGRKPFEVRFDDRGFKNGDVLRLREHIRADARSGFTDKEWRPEGYTGRELFMEVTYIIRAPRYGLRDKWCVMATREIKS